MKAITALLGVLLIAVILNFLAIPAYQALASVNHAIGEAVAHAGEDRAGRVR